MHLIIILMLIPYILIRGFLVLKYRFSELGKSLPWMKSKFHTSEQGVEGVLGLTTLDGTSCPPRPA
jgi:hypothetical protein